MSDAFEQFRELRWRDGIRCVFCGSPSHRYHSRRKSGVKRYACTSCGRIFSDVSGTFLASSKLSFMKWRQAASLFSHYRTISPRELQRRCKISYPTALRVLAFFKKVSRATELQTKTDTVLLPHENLHYGEAFFSLLQE